MIVAHYSSAIWWWHQAWWCSSNFFSNNLEVVIEDEGFCWWNSFSVSLIMLGIAANADNHSVNHSTNWQRPHSPIPNEWLDRNTTWTALVLIINATDQHFNWLKKNFVCAFLCVYETERDRKRERKWKRPQMRPQLQLCNDLEMLSEVQLMISKNTPLPLWSLSWIWCEDLTTKDQQTDQLKEQFSAQISRFRTTPALLHF